MDATQVRSPAFSTFSLLRTPNSVRPLKTFSPKEGQAGKLDCPVEPRRKSGMTDRLFALVVAETSEGASGGGRPK